MKSLTVGKRIILGFTALILIAIALGVTAIIQMGTAEEGATRLAEAYVPEVDVSNNVERNLMMAMYAIRGYSYTEQESYFDEGSDNLEATLGYLNEARQLGSEQNLAGMQAAEPEIRSDVTRYTDLTDQSQQVIRRMQALRAEMDRSAGAFVQAGTTMINQHERSTERDLQERSLKVTAVEEVMQHGNSARVNNFKAQATGNMEFAEDALDSLESALGALERLVPVTREAEDIAMIESVRRSINEYGQAIESYIAEIAQGELANQATLDALMVTMDRAATDFSENTRTFFAGQVEKLNANIRERVQKIGWVNDIIDLGNTARVNNFKSQALRDPSLMQGAITNIEEMDSVFAELEPLVYTAEGKANLNKTRDTAASYRQAMEDFLVAFNEMEDLNDQRIAVGMGALEGAKTLAATGMRETSEIAQTSQAGLAAASGIMVVGLIIATILGAVLALFITRSITGPLNLAIGNLSSGSSETSSAAGQVSSASQSLAEGASEQAASLEETSSSMEEMTSMVSRNAEVAKRTNQHAREASEAANDGVRSMGELRERADAVSVSAKEMEEAMQAIKQSSDSISKIIKTIDEIAFQTNILALNAAVEAARAGEAGAGFAVVADEVRSLARRAAEAAQETASMIEDSMERSERGVRVNETVGQNLGEVLQKAEQVEAGLKSISSTVSEVNSSMEELEASVREQQDGIGQINTAISQVNEVTQGNAASAEEAASAAEEMNAQSVNLLEIVGTLTEMVSGHRPENGSVSHGHSRSESTPGRARKITTTKRAEGREDKEQSFSLPGDFN
jgi:methyl-accepting chemotaxis protein